ncbi:CHASE domain-containing protein [Cupriavidus basilensis]
MRTLEDRVVRDDFDALFSPVFTALQRRLQDNEQLLRGTAGLFAADPVATREQWRNYLYTTQLDELPPGTQSIGYARLTPPRELDWLVETIRHQGQPGFEVYPLGPRDVYAPVVYVEPFAGRNTRALGFDILSDPVRRAAAEAARNSGEVRLTTGVELVHENETQAPQRGAVLYLPVYGSGLPLNTPVQRQLAVTGYVYTSLRLEDLLRSVGLPAAGALSLMLYDGRDTRPGALLAGDAEPGGGGRAGAAAAGGARIDIRRPDLDPARHHPASLRDGASPAALPADAGGRPGGDADGGVAGAGAGAAAGQGVAARGASPPGPAGPAGRRRIAARGPGQRHRCLPGVRCRWPGPDRQCRCHDIVRQSGGPVRRYAHCHLAPRRRHAARARAGREARDPRPQGRWHGLSRARSRGRQCPPPVPAA